MKGKIKKRPVEIDRGLRSNNNLGPPQAVPMRPAVTNGMPLQPDLRGVSDSHLLAELIVRGYRPLVKKVEEEKFTTVARFTKKGKKK